MNREVMQPDGPRAAERRRQILEAAVRCFRTHGFHQTTLRDIAHELGMSVGHIYNYFANKEALIEAMVEDSTERFLELVSSQDFEHGSDAQRMHLEKVVDAFLDTETTALAIAIMNEAMINPRIHKLTVAATERLREHILRLYYEKNQNELTQAVPKSEVEYRIIVIRAMLEGLRYAMFFNPRASRKRLREIAVDHLLYMIQAGREKDRMFFEKKH